MKSLIITAWLLMAFTLQAQQKIVFTNADSSKTIVVNQNDLVRIAYAGYMLQPQEAEGKVAVLNDSSITLAPRKKLFKKKAPSQTIMIRDITGFRRYSNFRPAGEIIYGIVGIGITGTITTVIGSVSIPAALGFASGAATGILTSGLKNVFFSTKIKNNLNDGWTMQVQPQQ